MPVLKYFVAVGTVLTFGLFALNAYLEPVPANAPVRVSITPTTASLLFLAPAPKKASPGSN
jgi:hypothetical protein